MEKRRRRELGGRRTVNERAPRAYIIMLSANTITYATITVNNIIRTVLLLLLLLFAGGGDVCGNGRCSSVNKSIYRYEK